MNPTFLQTPIDYQKYVCLNRANLLRAELAIHTYQDLIHRFPKRYIDQTRYDIISKLERNNADTLMMLQITHSNFFSIPIHCFLIKY